jgi:hypothetical protein
MVPDMLSKFKLEEVLDDDAALKQIIVLGRSVCRSLVHLR